MTCAEARQAILEADPSVLEGRGNDFLALHIQECPLCRDMAHAVLEGESLLSEELVAAVPPPELDAILDEVLGPGSTLKTLRFRHRRLGLTLLPLAAVATMVALFLGSEARLPGDPYIPPQRASGLGLEVPEGHNVAVMATSDPDITVRETRDNLDKISRVLDDFDQPIPGIRLYFQLIEADSFEDEDPAIADVVQELRSLFRFEGYRLLGEAMVPMAGGSQERQAFSQRFLGVDNPITVEAEARVLRSGVVRLDPVQLRDSWSQLMATSVNVTPGQTIVIGGTQARTELVSGSPTSETVLILTVRAEKE